MLNFQKFSKIPRLSRDIVVTEKIDGTNGQVVIFDNTDFAEYIDNNDPEAIFLPDRVEKDTEVTDFIINYCLYAEEITPDYHLYVFAGSRKRWLNLESDNYGFASWVRENAKELIDLGKGRHFGEWYGKGIQRNYGLQEKRFALFNVKRWENPEIRPACCGAAPVLWRGLFDTLKIHCVLEELRDAGSLVAPGFMNPEGIIIYHMASGRLFKKTIEDDEKPKGQTE